MGKADHYVHTVLIMYLICAWNAQFGFIITDTRGDVCVLVSVCVYV